uniref:Cytochrome b n=1 Tax=Dipseudopsis sp. XG-2021 TaxID=2996733 RepID=A0A9E8LNT4_9NEOP|nr:cytochrome b [Dipseudopsis sp. XG-2021]
MTINKSFISMNKSHPLISLMFNSVINLPTPSNISFMWNFGSLLGLTLMIQIITGIFLAMFYIPNTEYAFLSMDFIMRNINTGWLLRIIHSNSASMFFLFIYLHIGRNIYYDLFTNLYTWMSGIIILFILMMTAFIGYVLPWGQMSFWGATVITNLLSAIPYTGTSLVQWIWGGFSVNNATLNRFMSLHFLMPFILSAMIIIHLIFLHKSGSNNPLNLMNNFDKISFHPYFTLKDTLGFLISIMLLLLVSTLWPFLLSDTDNFIKANPMVTPPHIQPEWYFLFAYAILRSIPNKLGGVIALMMSILILMFMPTTFNKMIKGSNSFYPQKITFWLLSSTFILLSWLGSQPVNSPFIELSKLSSLIYFTCFFSLPLTNFMFNKFLKI